MKKNFFTFILSLTFLFLVSCEHPEKARQEIYAGTEQMMRYGDYQAAEKHFDKAIRYDKNNPEAYYGRGCCKANMQRYQEAIVDFQKAIELKPDYANAYFNLGMMYFYINDYDMMCYYYKLANENGRENMEDLMRSCQ